LTRLDSSTTTTGVPIEVLATFNKVKEISSDIDFITKVLRTSQTLQVSEDGKKVKRIAPLPEVDTLNERSIYVVSLFVLLLHPLSHLSIDH
jgi:hypothetical protein